MSTLKDNETKKRKPLMKTLKPQSDKKSVVSCKAVDPDVDWPVWP